MDAGRKGASMFLISACLLGKNCKYDGGNNETQWVVDFSLTHSFLPVCPEMAGGLETPRHPCEIVEKNGVVRVINDIGEDVTEAFEKGADDLIQAAQIAAMIRGQTIEGAILKSRSPSCGGGEIYDGTFTHTLIQGDGIFVRRLRRAGITVYTENDERQVHLIGRHDFTK